MGETRAKRGSRGGWMDGFCSRREGASETDGWMLIMQVTKCESCFINSLSGFGCVRQYGGWDETVDP